MTFRVGCGCATKKDKSILAALPVPQGEKEVSVLRLETPRFDRIANMIDKRPPAIYTQHNEDRLKWSSLEELEG
ncbi:hypothetical protein FRB95_006473 [Tulasnella sp. JGI-2019a]|nr:hypothetical protein FRB95_006473 [Tulasnella sp. JGI-2019a]